MLQYLIKAEPAHFDAVYRILLTSFPADELRPYGAQKALMTQPNFTAYITKDCSAVLTLWQLDSFSFIEHFAVDAAKRGQGLGSSLLQDILREFPCPICLEAELPDTELAKRRLDFYHRNGFAVNHYPYIQPSYGADRSPVPLLILSAGDPINESQFSHIRDTLYRQVYRAIP